jgi:hypothetical protein
MGAYYTPPAAAIAMAEWLLEGEATRVVEPSMGDGAFLSAVHEVARRRRRPVDVWGVELAADTFAKVVADGLVDRDRAFRQDFLTLEPFAVDGVIGNPPYVRLRHLPPSEARGARAATDHLLVPMDPSGSVWMPFVVHASRFLKAGGRMAFVLPYELTYVRYARPLWGYLARSFSSLRVVRIHERVFPEIMQDVVLFFADGYGGSTDSVRFDAYERVGDFTDQQVATPTGADIAIDRIIGGERPFVESLLSPRLRQLLERRIKPLTFRAREAVTFNIGYVSGDKTFFHPDDETLRRFRLPTQHLRPALTSSRQLRGVGIFTSGLQDSDAARLYLPDKDSLSSGDQAYIRLGERTAVAQRFKCRVRTPWYVTPGVKVPDVVVPVFTETPLMLANDARYVASNSLLCGYLRRGESSDALLARWYTSLTLLQIEIEVHALGGGVRVFVPNEAGALRLPREVRPSRDLLGRLDEYVRKGNATSAYADGDLPVLVQQVGLRQADVELIREGVRALAHWRNSSRTSRTSA